MAIRGLLAPIDSSMTAVDSFIIIINISAERCLPLDRGLNQMSPQRSVLCLWSSALNHNWQDVDVPQGTLLPCPSGITGIVLCMLCHNWFLNYELFSFCTINKFTNRSESSTDKIRLYQVNPLQWTSNVESDSIPRFDKELWGFSSGPSFRIVSENWTRFQSWSIVQPCASYIPGNWIWLLAFWNNRKFNITIKVWPSKVWNKAFYSTCCWDFCK